MAPKFSNLRVLGAPWLQAAGSVGYLGLNLRVLEAIWEVRVETSEKPSVFQGFWGGEEEEGEFEDTGFGWLAGGFGPRGVARSLQY